MTKQEVEDLIKKIKQLEPLNNADCPEWVINVIKAEEINKLAEESTDEVLVTILGLKLALRGKAIDQFRYVDHPEAFNEEVLERRKKVMSAADKKIQDLEKQIMVEHTENESLKMVISRANDTIKEQTGAIKMLKELLKEM